MKLNTSKVMVQRILHIQDRYSNEQERVSFKGAKHSESEKEKEKH